jgi:hypothetical protein
MNIDKFVRERGDIINGQITVAWYTRQTYEQLVEIWKDGGENPAEITEDDFLEYVKSNVAEFIRNEIMSEGTSGGDYWLMRELVVVDAWAQVVEAD